MDICQVCNKHATGRAYSMSVLLGLFCDLHGQRLLDDGTADASEAFDDDDPDYDDYDEAQQHGFGDI